jgi:ABC-type phosphate transport system substrate-binding protein
MGGSTLKRALTGLAIAGTLVASGMGFAKPASAGTDGNVRILGIVGSDTTSKVIGGLAEAYNVNVTYNSDGDKIINVPPLHSVGDDLEAGEATNSALSWLKAARLAWPGGEVLEADADCAKQRVFGGEGQIDANGDGDVTDVGDSRWAEEDIDTDGAGGDDLTVQVGAVAPNGSGAGRSYALDSANQPLGCIDMTRSSSAPSVAQQANFDTWAFALDAVGWNYFPGNTHAVLDLTQAQLGQIYTCATSNVDGNGDTDFNDVGDQAVGQPKLRYWGDLNGNPADTQPIRAYRIQIGSGTGEDVAKTLMGLSAASSIGSNCTSPTQYPVVQEHDCLNVATVDKPHAICFYGYSRWKGQGKALESDKRNGAKFGSFSITGSPLPPTTATIKEDPLGRYEGTRLVYNLILRNVDGTGTDLPGFDDAVTFTGVKPDPDGAGPLLATSGYICSNAGSKILKLWGMVPLKKATTDAADATYGQSYCRRNKYTL